jgi:trigger factor
MEKTIHQIGPAEYELEIRATADELAPEIDKAVHAQRARTQLKGFRPGKVPAQMVKKMFGRALAYGIAEEKIQKTFEEVRESGEHEILGAPQIMQLDYDIDKDLHAVVRFGVRPDIELKDLSGEKVTKLVHEVTDEEVTEEIERLRRREADLIPLEGAVGEQDFVLLDIQRLDDSTGAPVIGDKEEDVSFFLDDPRLKGALRDALLQKQAGETFRVDLPHESGHDHDEPVSELLEVPGGHGGHAHTHAYQVTIKEAKRRDLPDLDEEFIKKATQDKVQDEESLRALIRQELERSWSRSAREFLDQNIAERMHALHEVPVPASLTDVYLDSFVEDVKQRNKGKLPEGFDAEAFRETNRGEAEKQARWMLIRDKVIAEEGLEVTDEDIDRHFQESPESEGLSPEILRQFYTSMPGLMDRLKHRILSEKVFTALERRFTVEEKNKEEIEREIEERNEQEAAGSKLIV